MHVEPTSVLAALACLLASATQAQVMGGPPPPFPSQMLAPPSSSPVPTVASPTVAMSGAPISVYVPRDAFVDGTGLADLGAATQQLSDAYSAAAQQAAANAAWYSRQEKLHLDVDRADWEVKKFEHEQAQSNQKPER